MSGGRGLIFPRQPLEWIFALPHILSASSTLVGAQGPPFPWPTVIAGHGALGLGANQAGDDS